MVDGIVTVVSVEEPVSPVLSKSSEESADLKTDENLLKETEESDKNSSDS